MPDSVPRYAPRSYLSVTSLMDFVRCPRRYMYRKSGLQSQEQSGAPVYGTAMHKAVPIALTEGFAPAYAAFRTVWDGSLDDDKRNLRRAEAQLKHFAFSHAGSKSIYTFETPPDGGIKLEEDTSPFEVPVVLDVGLAVPLVLRIDGLVRHRDTGELWGWEFKTVSGWAWSKIFENLEMHPQILAYTLALKTVTGLNVRGMMTEAMLIDKTKVENMTHPIPVQEHQLENILNWLRYYGSLLLACEARAAEIAQGHIAAGDSNALASWDDQLRAFPQNFAGCSAYPQYYLPSFGCDYANLCRVAQPSNMVSFYDIVEDHQFIKLTKEGK